MDGLALPGGGPEDVTHLNDRELLLRIVLTQEHITQQIQELSASHQNLRAFVYGNGSPGLADMVRDSQRWISVINRATWALLIPMILSIVGFFMAVLTNKVEIVVH